MRLIYAALLALFVVQAGCQAPPIDPAADKLVVTAERELKNAVDTVDEFFLFDYQNHDFMVQNLPEVHSFAQQLRNRDTGFYPRYYDPALSAVRLYKQSRAPSDGQAQEDRLAVLRDIVAQVRLALLRSQSAKARPPTTSRIRL